jgi:hypothetical protein
MPEFGGRDGEIPGLRETSCAGWRSPLFHSHALGFDQANLVVGLLTAALRTRVRVKIGWPQD